MLCRQYSLTHAASNIVKYNEEYEQFLRTTKLRDIALARMSKGEHAR
jgi:hypothetical protein